jgi:hypothetical protein
MENNKIIKIFGLGLLVIGIFLIFSVNFVVAQNTIGTNSGNYRVFGSSVNPQFTNPAYNSASISPFYGGTFGTSTTGYQFDERQCQTGGDILMQIIPGSCSPPVIRSDLLEEQNVPVFCKVRAIQINPLIDISRVRSLHFKGDYPKGISGVSYFPARAAVRTNNRYNQPDILDSPIRDNLGYLVIVVSKQAIERDMPDFVEGNITATIDYDSEGSFGIGNTNFYANEMSDQEWARDYRENGFWNGKAYLRAESVESDRATIAIYRDADSRQKTVTLKKGETSKDVHLTGYYCSAGMKIKLEDITAPVESALIQVDDKQTWVSKGDKFLDGKCSVLDLKTYSGGGKLSVSCSSIKRFDLSLNPENAEFILGDGRVRKVAVNEMVDSSKKIYLTYVGQDNSNTRYVVLVEDKYSNNEREFLDRELYEVVTNSVKKSTGDFNNLKNEIITSIKNKYKKVLTSEQKKDFEKKLIVSVLKEKEVYSGIKVENIFAIADKNWDGEGISNEEKLAKEYYETAIEKYEDLADFYPQEKGAGDPYAATGLFEAARLSKQFEMNAKAIDFYNRLIREYPDSDVAKEAERNKALITKYDSLNSKAAVIINNEQHFIDLLDFRKPRKEDASAVLMINSKESVLELGEIENIGNTVNLTQRIEVKKLDTNNIVITYLKKDGNKKEVVKDYTLDLNKNIEVELDGVRVKLFSINVKKQAKISIQPSNYGTRSESKFSFRIGIEKRAIKLSPEMAAEMAQNLVKTIKQLNDINDKLGNVIKVMKAGCFATSAVLTAKTLLNGLDGESMARNEIMTNSKGWNYKCEDLVDQGKYISVQECLLDNKDAVEGDIDIYANEIKKTNNIMKEIQQGIGIERSDSFDIQGQVNSQKVNEEFEKKFKEWCKNNPGSIQLPDKQESLVSFSGDKGICNYDTLTQEQRREIMTLSNVRNSGSDVLKDMANDELGKIVLNGKNYEENNNALSIAEKNGNEKNLGIGVTKPVGDKITYGDMRTITKGDSGHEIYKNIEVGKKVVRVYIPVSKVIGSETKHFDNSVAGKEVIVELNRIEQTGEYKQEGDIYLVSSGRKLDVDSEGYKSVKEYLDLADMNRIKQTDETTYQNPMREPDRLKVKFFERAPYKGLPSEIPFDVQEGWYVEMTYVLSGFGKPYDESGRVVNYYICNVGPNGRIEFKQSNDDICRYYNEMTGADLNFPGMSASDSRKLITKAQKAIADASRQYGKKRVTINGRGFDTGISFGGETGRCTDFMSAEDCNILFNVCDPVICPASRCDLGGDYRVDNVMQTGIVGSLVLCMPNYREGIMVPICLTGVHAGLEGYISILNSTVQCLNESVNTGRNIGICDEIRSIYLCEFFWKQVGPFLEVLFPRLIEGAYGQVRGGGEYSVVTSAWQNTQNAIDYFRNDYAVNSMQAFSARSTSSIGGDFCSSFISQSVPGSASFFDRLLEPDSPVQYHGWFSEIPMTSATVPPISHYKVYYHIYSGKDMGASYHVYLKDLPNVGGYIHTTGFYTVDRGYIARGSQVDQAKDFTATSGFKQLCISVNGKEECGFGQVSTSFVVNQLSDEYVKDQIEQDIITEKECVAGTPYASLPLSPNLQANVEDTINPEIYNKGVIRVCSTGNPGKQVLNSKYDTTSPNSNKWREVGYCDDQSIKCWLDTDSVKDVIRNKGIEEDVLTNVDAKSILEEIGYLTSQESASLANRMESAINSLIIGNEGKESIENKIKDIVEGLDLLTELGTDNSYRARGLFLFGKMYKKIASNLLKHEVSKTVIKESEGLEEIDSGDETINDDASLLSYKRSFNVLAPRGGDYENLYYFYDDLDGWFWTSDVSFLNWNHINLGSGFSEYDELSESNKAFLTSLKNKDCDDGLKALVLRVLETDSFSSRLIIVTPENTEEDFDIHQDINDVSCESKFERGLSDEDKEFLEFLDEEEIEDVSSGVKLWVDDDLKINQNIRVKKNSFRGEITYRYDGEKWIFDSQKDTSFDREYGYVDGIRVLIERTTFSGGRVVIGENNLENIFTESDKEMADRVFEVLKKSLL